jgi:hypothetical protein
MSNCILRYDTIDSHRGQANFSACPGLINIEKKCWKSLNTFHRHNTIVWQINRHQMFSKVYTIHSH